MIQPQPAFTLHLRFQPFSSFVPKWAQALDPPRILRLYNTYLSNTLDRHQVWLSHDPTSVQNSDFCEKKVIIPPFLKKTQLFVIHISFCNFPFTSSVALVAMLHGFTKVNKGYHRLFIIHIFLSFKKTQFLFICICPVIRTVSDASQSD